MYAGHYFANNTCVKCDDSLVATAYGSDKCSACPEGRVASEDQTVCLAKYKICTVGEEYNNNGESSSPSCDLCKPGEQSVGCDKVVIKFPGHTVMGALALDTFTKLPGGMKYDGKDVYELAGIMFLYYVKYTSVEECGDVTFNGKDKCKHWIKGRSNFVLLKKKTIKEFFARKLAI